MNVSTIRRNFGKLIAGLAFGALMMTSAPVASAELVVIDDGAWMNVLGAASGEEGSLILVQMTLDPGAELRAHQHPGAAVVTVESGTLETEVVRGSGTIYRASEANTQQEASTQQAIRGTFATLQAGDSIAYDEYCGKTMANTGNEPLVLSVTLLASEGEELFVFLPITPGARSTAQ